MFVFLCIKCVCIVNIWNAAKTFQINYICNTHYDVTVTEIKVVIVFTVMFLTLHKLTFMK